MSNKVLFLKALKADAGSVEQLTDTRFRVGVNEYEVWTDQEAADFGYHAGGIETTDEARKVYRIF